MATKTTDRFEVDFTPYPRVLKSTQRSMYRNNQEAINDITDDSIDAEATDIYIDIEQLDNKPLLIISDNGWGMDLETLKTCLKLGVDHKTTYSTHGTYGIGKKFALGHFQGDVKIITKTWNGDSLTLDYNINELVENGFKTNAYISSESEKKLFKERVRGKDKNGTVVIIRNIETSGLANSVTAGNTIRKKIGRTYWRLINDGDIRIHVNGEKAKPIDPMFYEIPLIDQYTKKRKSTLLGEREVFDLKYIDRNGVQKNDGYAKISFYMLPDLEPVDNQKYEISEKSCGGYFFRNDRGIVFGKKFDKDIAGKNIYFTATTNHKRFRYEISYGPQLDTLLGTSPNKNDLVGTKVQFFDFYPGFQNEFKNAREIVRKTAELDGKGRRVGKGGRFQKYTKSYKNHVNRKRLPIRPISVSKSKFVENISSEITERFDIETHSDGSKTSPWFSKTVQNQFGKGRQIKLSLNEDHDLYQSFLDNDADVSVLATTYSIATALSFAKWGVDPETWDMSNDDYLDMWETIEKAFGDNLHKLLNQVNTLRAQ